MSRFLLVRTASSASFLSSTPYQALLAVDVVINALQPLAPPSPLPTAAYNLATMFDLGLVLTFLTFVLSILLYRILTRPSHHNLPPSPPTTSIIGLHHLPSSHPWRTFSQWTEKYGSIFTLYLSPFSPPTFVLGTATSAHAIIEKQSAHSSGF